MESEIPHHGGLQKLNAPNDLQVSTQSRKSLLNFGMVFSLMNRSWSKRTQKIIDHLMWYIKIPTLVFVTVGVSHHSPLPQSEYGLFYLE